jgi:oligopeptide transport system permease protein
MSAVAGFPSPRKAYGGNVLVQVCLGLLLMIAVVSVIGVLASPYSVDTISFDQSFIAPTFDEGHLFGTDDLGRDVFVRTLKGTQITFLVAIIATLVSLVIGVLYGAVAGYLGGKTDAVMMRAVDALYAMPFIFFVILLMVVFERSLFLIFIAIGAINWLDTARIVRGQTMSLKQRAFVDAARLTGVSNFGIILRHIAPNLFGIVVVYVTLTIPQVILFESFLSFLGLGVQEPQTSLGALVSEGVARMERAPWMLFFPASFLALMLFCLNFLGDGLRDVLDPKSHRK